MFQVLAEVMPSIATCNIYISQPQNCISYQTMNVKNRECTFHFDGGTELCLKLPIGSSLVPDAVKNVKQEGTILTARVQMDKQASVISALAGDILSDSFTCKGVAPSTTLVNTQLLAHCKQCKYEVFRGAEFRRVLPLPSVDWDQASEGWFCHLHECDGQKLKPRALQPTCDECFYTELFFLVHSDLLTSGTETGVPEGDVNCPECKLSLGTKASQSTKLWTHSIVWLQECGTILYKKNASEMVLSLFHNIDKDNFGVNCRLVLQAQTVPRLHLYMITMNTNQKLLLSDNNFDSNGTVFRDSDHTTENDMQCREAHNETDLELLRSKRMCKRQTEISLKSVYAVKLLYHMKEGEDEETGSWVDDAFVHIIPCSVSMLEEVRAMLESSTCYLPNPIRVVDNLSVGYIIKDSIGTLY